jgi:hypothetical protein
MLDVTPYQTALSDKRSVSGASGNYRRETRTSTKGGPVHYRYVVLTPQTPTCGILSEQNETG